MAMLRIALVVGVLAGVLMAGGGLALAIAASPIAGAATDLNGVFIWSVVFLIGMFISGWCLARLISSR